MRRQNTKGFLTFAFCEKWQLAPSCRTYHKLCSVLENIHLSSHDDFKSTIAYKHSDAPQSMEPYQKRDTLNLGILKKWLTDRQWRKQEEKLNEFDTKPKSNLHQVPAKWSQLEEGKRAWRDTEVKIRVLQWIWNDNHESKNTFFLETSFQKQDTSSNM